MIFRHLNKERKPFSTICFDKLPTVEQLKDSISILNPYVTLDIGVSVLHPKDRYVKKTGREESQKALQQSRAELVGVDKRLNSIVYTYKVDYKRPTKNNNSIATTLYFGLQYDSFGVVKVKYVSREYFFDSTTQN